MAAGAEIDQHYAVARRLAFQVEEQLQQLETGRETSVSFQANISTNLNQLAHELGSLDGLVAREPSAQRRTVWKKKLRQLSDTSAGLRAALDKYVSRSYRNAREAEERAQLLQRRNGAAGDHGGEVAIEMDSLARETRSLHDADSSLDMLQAHGAAVLEALSAQSATLRSSRQKLAAVFDTLGLSNSLLRLIESRQLTDKALLWGGMLLTAGLLYALLRWTRG